MPEDINTSVTTFFSMGGYAYFVWSAYGITALVLLVNLTLALRAKRAQLRRIRQQPRSV